MSGKLEAQCWICPKCHDDHSQDGPCPPPKLEAEPWMPSVEDQSYIAKAYRSRVADLERTTKELSDLRRQFKSRSRIEKLETLISGHIEAMRPLLDEWSKLK